MGWVPGISQCANALVPRPALPAGGETRCSLAGGLESVRLCPSRGLWDSVSSSFSFSLSGPKVRSFPPPWTSTVKRCFSMDPVSHQRHPGAPDAVPQNVSPWEVTTPSICYHDRKLSKIPNIPAWLMEHDPTNGDELLGATFKACCFQRVSFYTSGHKHIQERFTGRFLSASSFLSFFPILCCWLNTQDPPHLVTSLHPEKRWPSGVETDPTGREGQPRSWAWPLLGAEPHGALQLQCFREVSGSSAFKWVSSGMN